jgi:hypothetical protein
VGYKKVKKEIKKFGEKEYSRGHKDGYEVGLEVGAETVDEEFRAGVQAERHRTVNLFRMLMDGELEHGSGNKAKFWKEAADVVKIADELEVFDEEGNPINEF